MIRCDFWLMIWVFVWIFYFVENLVEVLFWGEILLSGFFYVNIGLKWNEKIREGFNVIRVVIFVIGRLRLKFLFINNYKIGVW